MIPYVHYTGVEAKPQLDWDFCLNLLKLSRAAPKHQWEYTVREEDNREKRETA